MKSNIDDEPPEDFIKLIKRKNYGAEERLNTPSASTLKITQRSERAFKILTRYRKYWDDISSEEIKIPNGKNLKELKAHLLASFKNKDALFPRIGVGNHETNKEDIKYMIKTMIDEYLLVKKFDFGKEYTRMAVLK